MPATYQVRVYSIVDGKFRPPTVTVDVIGLNAARRHAKALLLQAQQAAHESEPVCVVEVFAPEANRVMRRYWWGMLPQPPSARGAFRRGIVTFWGSISRNMAEGAVDAVE